MSVFHYTSIRIPSPYAEDTDHPQGFILIRFLKGIAVTLVYSLDDQKFFIHKVIRNNVYAPDEPAEIRFSNLATDSPFQVLPFLPVVVESANLEEDYSAYGLILEAYNGGTQDNLVEKFEEKNMPVPESYVWHFIEQMARAYAYLHFGHINGKKSGSGEWTAIVHRDGAANNIFLHFPDPRKKPRRSDKFIDAFPKLSTGGCFDQAGIHPWEDVVLFGEAVRHMLYTSTEYLNAGDINLYPRLRNAGLENIYSEDLIAALEPFEPSEGPHCWDNDNAVTLPDMRHVAEVLLPQAIQKVQEYKNAGGYEPVRWVQPQPTTVMPFFVRPDDVKGLRQLYNLDHGGTWFPKFDAVDFRSYTTAGVELVKLEEPNYPACLKQDFNLELPGVAFDQQDDLWETAFHTSELLKASIGLAQEREAENGVEDPEVQKDIGLLKAARRVIRPVFHEGSSSSSSSAGAKSGTSTADSPAAETPVAKNTNAQEGARRPKTRSRSRSKGVKSEASPKSVKPEAKPVPADQEIRTKRTRSVSVESNRDAKRQKGEPRLRETITTTTVRERY